GDRRMGFRTLLFLGGQPVGMEPPLVWRGGKPVERYMAQVERWDDKQRLWNGGPLNTFWERMESFYGVVLRLQKGNGASIGTAEAERLLRFVAECRSPATAWTVTDVVLRNTANKEAGKQDANELKKKLLEAACRATEGSPDFHYVARYEQARFLSEI